MAKASKASPKKAMTKSAFLAEIVEKAKAETGKEVTKKDIEAILDSIIETVKSQLKNPGKFVFPGLARMTLTKVKAVKGGVEKTNPLNGQKYVTKDKPAYNKVNLRPIKAIKEALK